MDELPPEVVEELRRGERAAFLLLVERYEGRIYNFAARMCRSREQAWDVLQETFVGALRGVRDFRGDARLSTWLFKIAANACLRMKRRRKGEPERELSLEDFMPKSAGEAGAALVDPGETPEAALLRTDLRERLDAGIAALPPAYRAVLVLRDLEGLSAAETAEALGLEIAAVKSRLHRARLFLRERLAARVRG